MALFFTDRGQTAHATPRKRMGFGASVYQLSIRCHPTPHTAVAIRGNTAWEWRCHAHVRLAAGCSRAEPQLAGRQLSSESLRVNHKVK